jgi:hypothetical protein
MSKETPQLPDRRDWDNLAADAVELARLMPPGPERSKALKRVSFVVPLTHGINPCKGGQAAEVKPQRALPVGRTGATG